MKGPSIPSLSRRAIHWIGFAILLALLPLKIRAESGSCRSAMIDALNDLNPSVESVRSGRLDPEYLKTVSAWARGWRDAVDERLVGKVDETADIKSANVAGFRLSNFLQSREFRTFFESQNRMISYLKEPLAMIDARVKLLPNPQDALKAKLLAIRQATHTVDATYYIFRSDNAGMAMIGEFKDALKRGVNVRVMYDGLGAGTATQRDLMRSLMEFAKKDAGYARELDGTVSTRRATFTAVEFQPTGQALVNQVRSMIRSIENFARRIAGKPEIDPLTYSINRRSHDKMLLVDSAFTDRAIVFTGGRNIGDEYYRTATVKDPTNVDMEVMMRTQESAALDAIGPQGEPSHEIGGVEPAKIGTEFQKYYDTLYFHLGNRAIQESVLDVIFPKAERTLEQVDKTHAAALGDLGLDGDTRALSRTLLEDGFSDQQVEVVNTFHNLYRKHASKKFEFGGAKTEIKNSKALVDAMMAKMAKEDKEITLISPYLWMSDKQIRLTKAWLLKNPDRKLNIFTNSMATSDNVLAQIMVDSVMGPQLMLDRGLTNSKGEVIRRSIADQVKIYEYGKKAALDKNPTVSYGNMHMKGAYLKGTGVTVAGTYNNDPRSLLLNSEGAAIITGAETASQMQATIDGLLKDSHLWGSDEYHEIRSHPSLPLAKRIVSAHMQLFYKTLVKLNLWWLI